MTTKSTPNPKFFLHESRTTEVARHVDDRLSDFKHVYAMPCKAVARTQAQRCMGCGVPFCHGDHGCPLHNSIPDWNELVGKGEWREALMALHATNNFPEFTGQLCPAPCESACVLSLASAPVTIRQIELAIIHEGFAQGFVHPQPPLQKRHTRAAIIGSGPCGLAAAQQLARSGHKVTVYEKTDRLGGLLRYGIPDFKMEKWILDRRLEQLRAEGVEFVTGAELGGNIILDDLVAQHHAIGLAIGAESPRILDIPGSQLRGIVPAMTYLTQQNRQVAGDSLSDRINAKDCDVVILGGGDTGSDCLGTALRQGARSVQQFELLPRPPKERSAETPWPLWPMQLKTSHAHEEGGDRQWSIATTAFSGENGAVTHLHTIQVEDRSGQLVPIPGTERTLAANLVILATGFTGVASKVTQSLPGVAFTGRGVIETNAAYMTKRKGVFAAGDARRGASLIVWAIAEGRSMAKAMDQYLLNH